MDGREDFQNSLCRWEVRSEQNHNASKIPPTPIFAVWVSSFASQHPKECKLIDDDEQCCKTFEMKKGRFGFKLTLPYTEERRKTTSELAKNHTKNLRMNDNESPAAKAGNMGKEKCAEVLVWTKDEYLKFIETLKGKPASYYAFETLYWCSLRLGEMLALTPANFDSERKIIQVTKSFQRIKGEDIITPPKTEKGIRRVLMPDFYADKLKDYLETLQLTENVRIFPFIKSYLHNEMRCQRRKANTDPWNPT